MTDWDDRAAHNMTVEGVVREGLHGYVKVRCYDAPRHLQVIYLEPRQLGVAKIGDRVRLEYRVTRSRADWVVVKVLL